MKILCILFWHRALVPFRKIMDMKYHDGKGITYYIDLCERCGVYFCSEIKFKERKIE